MNRSHLKAWILTGSIVSGLLYVQSIAAQVIPDATLPAGELSQVTGNPNVQIDGGARRGGNLFHSFSQFSIPTGGSAYFNNAAEVQNIFSRVTGGSVSNIDGLIRANGTANLFLLNPNGILFGPNASLNLGGSFVGTTANAIGFPNREVFSSDATKPLPSQLLTINPNAFFFNQLAAQAIINQSTANKETGLRVPAAQSLLLVGGDIRLEGGRIVSPASRVELGAVAGLGSVGLSQTAGEWRLSFPNDLVRADVSLNNRSRIDVRAGGGGSIAVTARNLTMNQTSFLQVGINSGLGFVGASAGNLTVDATQTVTLKDVSLLVNYVEPGATGNAGNINILTGSLDLINGSQLFANTYGNGNAGQVNVNARERVSFVGQGNNGFTLVSSGAFSSVAQGAVGNGSDINIETGSLSMTGGAGLYAITFGKGNAGNINIVARERVSFDGIARSGSPTGAFSSIEQSGIGNAGNINIRTRSLSMTGGAGLLALTEGNGNAGDIIVIADAANFSGVSNSGLASGMLTSSSATANGQGGNIKITAGTLSIQDGAVITAATYSAAGKGGNLRVDADTVGVSSGGQLLTTTFSSGNAGNITVNTPDLQLSGATSGLFAQTTSTGDAGNLTIQPRDNGQSVRVNLQDGAQISASTSSSGRGGELTIAAPESITLTGNGSIIAAGTKSSGNGGNLILRTDTLNVQDRAEVTVSSSGTGTAGSLFVDADRIFLNHQGSIRADTTGGGGNINLRSPFILLRNGSNITTNATGANIPGGNITTDTRFLIAVPKEDSNISANSEDFRGGNVRINAFSIFGIQPSLVSTPLSEITATGATSALSGTIDVITAGIDPTSGLVALPTDLADQSGLIAQGCPADRGNSFVITGRGGLPPTPEQQLDDDAEWSDRRRLVVDQQVDSTGGHGLRRERSTERNTQTRRHEESFNSKFKTQNSKLPDTPIIEATGWRITPAGEIFLVADTPDPTVQNRLNQFVACQGRR
ncbi:MAG: filamentous hemagglutinin N-terminal domain-containing protein [Brasilonema octagenarum HA4186-MV1]|jgi:filamentous hemagglutinin family protein|nr:filamentous hemagglutinin N-terminal domain-containing protein [Brasilonema octagenarum HA4186-MV1]